MRRVGRRKELHETISKLLAAAGAKYQLLHSEAYPITLDRGNFQVELKDDPKRPDVSRVALQVRAEVAQDRSSSGQAQIHALCEFVQRASRAGRTEIHVDDDTALGMNRPERFRYELIQSIADDSRRIAATLGSSCAITLDVLTAESSGNVSVRLSSCRMCLTQ